MSINPTYIGRKCIDMTYIGLFGAVGLTATQLIRISLNASVGLYGGQVPDLPEGGFRVLGFRVSRFGDLLTAKPQNIACCRGPLGSSFF